MAVTTRIAPGYGDPLLLSPPIPVEWAGFTSDTRMMQRCGWEFAVERNTYGFSIHILARHRILGLMMNASIRDDDLRNSALIYSKPLNDYTGFRGPPMQFREINHESRVSFIHMNPEDLERVDMNPQYTTIQEHRWNGDAIDLFRKWAPQAEELIVDPNDVTALFERIKKLQTPQLAEIRERNRKRDAREQRSEQVVAQIVTLA